MNIEDLKKIIKQKKITYKEIAQSTGLSIGTLNEIFRGKTKNPRLDTLKLICNYVNENTNNLFEDAKIKPYLTNEEEQILNTIRKLNRDQKNKLMGYLNALLEFENIKK